MNAGHHRDGLWLEAGSGEARAVRRCLAYSFRHCPALLFTRGDQFGNSGKSSDKASSGAEGASESLQDLLKS